MNSNDFFTTFQKQLIQWICAKGFVTWKQISEKSKILIEPLQDEDKKLLGNYPEYKLFMPLLRAGIAEVCTPENKKVSFCVIPKTESQQPRVDPLELLEQIPTNEDIIMQFEIENSVELHYKCDLNDKYEYKQVNNSTACGIYKTVNEVYVTPYLVDANGKTRTIPKLDDNPDSINWARCYERKYSNAIFFKYNKLIQELFCNNYSELPILVTRALYLCDTEHLNTTDCYTPFNAKKSFNKITSTIILELQRIFGIHSVREL